MRFLIPILIIFFLIPFVSAELSISFDSAESDLFELSLNVPESPINYSLLNVSYANMSAWWNTSDYGPITSVSILNTYLNHSLLNELEWSEAGHIMDEDLDIGEYEFLGSFNWTSGDNWNLFDGDELTFNETKLTTIYYNATSITVVTGTTEGALTDIQSFNSIPYNVSEDASDIEFMINFTGVTDFNNLIIRYRAELDYEQHETHIYLWDYDNDEWEHKGDLPSEPEWNTPQFPIYDSDEHISGGVVSVRIEQDGGAPPRTHKHEFDWVTISLGFGTPAQEEVDPFFHAWLMDPIFDFNINGTNNNLTDWNWLYVSNINVSNNITASNFCDDGGCYNISEQLVGKYLLANGSTELTGNWNYGAFNINGSGKIISNKTLIGTTGTIWDGVLNNYLWLETNGEQNAFMQYAGGDQRITHHLYSDGIQKAIHGYDVTSDAYKFQHKESGTSMSDTGLCIKENKGGIGTCTFGAYEWYVAGDIYGGSITSGGSVSGITISGSWSGILSGMDDFRFPTSEPDSPDSGSSYFDESGSPTYLYIYSGNSESWWYIELTEA